jgi:uncharacterized protein YecT (DUF1311 family)
MKALVLALPLLAPLPLAAQDLVFSTEALDACFAAGGWEDCIGTAANQCMADTEGGESTIGMAGCLEAELNWWDAALNGAYGDVIAAAQALDAEAQDGAPSQEEAAREMQRAWIAFRDATCNYEVLDWFGGTGANAAWTACLMRMTGEQALYLQSALAAG